MAAQTATMARFRGCWAQTATVRTNPEPPPHFPKQATKGEEEETAGQLQPGRCRANERTYDRPMFACSLAAMAHIVRQRAQPRPGSCGLRGDGVFCALHACAQN